MLRALRHRRLALCVLTAFFAAQTFAAVVHEHLHHHPSQQPGSANACHHAGDVAAHAHHGHRHCRPASGVQQASRVNQSNGADQAKDHQQVAGTSASHGDCVVCQVLGQPVDNVATASVEIIAAVCAGELPCPAAAPRTACVRIAQSRAPPLAG